MNTHVVTTLFLALLLFNCSLYIEKNAVAVPFEFPNPTQTNTYPVANFTYSPKDAVVNHPVYFYDHSYHSDPYGTIVFWEWDFGDGVVMNATTPEEANKTHTYTVSKEFVVTLTVVDNQNHNKSVDALIFVRKIGTILTLNHPGSVMQGSTIALKVILRDEYETLLPNMEISFYEVGEEGESLLGMKSTDSSGQASFDYVPQTTGSHRIKAFFNGTDIYAESYTEITFDVTHDVAPYIVVGALVILLISAVFAYVQLKSRKKEKETEEKEEEEEAT